MDSGFATTMASAVDALKSGFDSFTGSTIAGGVWEGDASENAKTQVTSKIDPKVEKAKEKLGKLVSAIDMAKEAETAKYNMEEADRAIGALDSSATNYAEEKAKLEKQKEEFKKTFDELVEKIKSTCSG